MNTLQVKLEKLKNKFIEFDVFGDNDAELRPIYFEMIDSIQNKNDIEQLKQQFLADDLLYSDPEEIENTEIFKILDLLL
jgi:hypothetical protein